MWVVKVYLFGRRLKPDVPVLDDNASNALQACDFAEMLLIETYGLKENNIYLNGEGELVARSFNGLYLQARRIT